MNSLAKLFVFAVVAVISANAGNLGLVRTVGVAPAAYSSVYSHAAPAAVVKTYSAPVVAAAPVVKTYAAPVVKAYSAPVVAAAPTVLKTHYAAGAVYGAAPVLL